MSVPSCTTGADRYIKLILSAAKLSLPESTSQQSTPFEATNTNHPYICTPSSYAMVSIVFSSLSSMGWHTSPILTKPTVLDHNAISSLTTTFSKVVVASVASAKTGFWKLFSPCRENELCSAWNAYSGSQSARAAEVWRVDIVDGHLLFKGEQVYVCAAISMPIIELTPTHHFQLSIRVRTKD